MSGFCRDIDNHSTHTHRHVFWCWGSVWLMWPREIFPLNIHKHTRRYKSQPKFTGTRRNSVRLCSRTRTLPELGDCLAPLMAALKAGVHNRSLNSHSVWSGTGNKWGLDLSSGSTLKRPYVWPQPTPTPGSDTICPPGRQILLPRLNNSYFIVVNSIILMSSAPIT